MERPLAQLVRASTTRLGTLGICAIFGMAYGAVCGGVYGTILFAGVGTFFGAIYGALGGLLTGIVGGLLRGAVGWGLAGALGALAPLLLLVGRPELLFEGPAVLTVIPSLIGGVLGVAVGAGLRRGSSALPGVTALATVVNVPRSQDRPLLRPAATELLPSDPPPGRGSETAPAPPDAGQPGA